MVLGRFEGGGPPTIGDFDGDGFPEVAVAGGTRLRVFDFDCAAGGPDCMPGQPFVRWSQPSQDGSSKQTGGSAFDFDGDKQVEVVYADECFLRVYDGRTGVVKYSAFRTSNTWYEGPVIADVNKDQTTKIPRQLRRAWTAMLDGQPQGKALRRSDSPRSRLQSRRGLPEHGHDLRQTRIAAARLRISAAIQVSCARHLLPARSEPGNTCRAQHPNGSTMTGVNPIQHGIRVLNDKLNRWASSRPMWNQHAYSVTNINDDGTIPKTSDWLAKQNFKVMGLNNYRQNVQGPTAVDELPDITAGSTETPVSSTATRQLSPSISATVASAPFRHRSRSPSTILPAPFCVPASPTARSQPATGCKPVRCTIAGADTIRVIGKTVTIKANDDGHGQRGTVECNYDNNGDSNRHHGLPRAGLTRPPGLSVGGLTESRRMSSGLNTSSVEGSLGFSSLRIRRSSIACAMSGSRADANSS